MGGYPAGAILGGVRVFSPQMVTAVLMLPHNPLDDLKAHQGRVPGNYDITDAGMLTSIGLPINEDFIACDEQGLHRGSCYPVALAEPDQPQ